MALDLIQWNVSVALIDQGGNVTTRSWDLITAPVDDDVTATLTEIAAFLVVLQGVTKCTIKNYTLSRKAIESALVVPTNGAEVEAHAIITAPIFGDATESATIDIPAPEDGLFTAASGAGYNVVDVSDAALLAYLDYFTNGEATQMFYVSDGEEITQENLRGKRTHSKSVRG